MKALILFFLMQSIAFSQFVKSDGKFFSDPEDSLSLVKEQLLYESTKKLVTTELEDMGLDHELFWIKYEELLNVKLGEEEVSLREKMRMDVEKVPVSRKKRFEKTWRLKRLKVQREFANIQRTLDSYKVLNLSRSSNNPQMRYMKMEGKINRDILRTVYFELFRDVNEDTRITNLYWGTEINLKQGDWGQIDVEDKENLMRVLNTTLEKKIKENFEHIVTEITFADGDMEKNIDGFMATKNIEIGESEEAMTTEFANSGYLKFSYDVYIENVDKDLARVEIKGNGRVSFVDLTQFEPIYFENLKNEDFNLYNKSSTNKGSQLASKIFGKFTPEIMGAKNHLERKRSGFTKSLVSITGHGSMSEIFGIQSLLNKMGITLQMSSEIEKFSLKNTALNIRYKGKEEVFRQILLSLNGKKIENDRILNVKGEFGPITMMIK